MSLYGALFSGVSGLQAQSSAMGAISDNISNVNTIGYKGTTVNFSTLVTTQVATTEYSPGGVQSKPRAGINVQGLLQSTNSSTDVALSGQGFFVVNSVASPSTEGGSFGYTRAGSFTPDKSGYLVNANGSYLQGWPLTPTDNSPAAVPGQQVIDGTTYMKAYKNSNGTYHYINQNIVNPQEVQPLNLNTIGGTAQPTSSVAMGANLPSGDPIYDAEHPELGGVHTTNVLTYDSLGNTGNAQFTWTKTGNNAWSLGATPPAGAAVLNLTNYSTANGSLVYASQGQLEFNSIPPSGSFFQVGPTTAKATNPTVQVQFYNSGVSGQNVDPTTDPTAANPTKAILGVDLNGVTNTTELTTAIQAAMNSAANSPSVKKTYTMAATLLGGVADGATRFVANSNVLRITQEPKAAAIQVDCSSSTLGNSIVESATGVGSSSLTPGVFTIPAIYDGGDVTATPAYGAYSKTAEATSLTVANSLGSTGTNSFTISAAPANGNFSVDTSAGVLQMAWTDIEAGTQPLPYTLNGNAATLTLTAVAAANLTAGGTTAQTATNLVTFLNNFGTTNISPYVTAAANGNQVSITNAGDLNTVTGASYNVSVTALSVGGGAAANIIWADGKDAHTVGDSSESLNASPNLQIGKIEIPWSQINSGLVNSYLDDSTTGAASLGHPTTNVVTNIALPIQPLPASQSNFTVTTGGVPTGTFKMVSSAGTLTIPWAVVENGTAANAAIANPGITFTPPNGTTTTITPSFTNLPNLNAATAVNASANMASLLNDISMTAYLPPGGFTATAGADVATDGTLSFTSPTEAVNINADAGGVAAELGNWGNGTAAGGAAAGVYVGSVSAAQSAENAISAINGLGPNVLNGVTASTWTSSAPTSITLNSGANPTQIFANNGGAPKDILYANGIDASSAANAKVLGQIGVYSSATGQAVSFNGDGTPNAIIPNAMQMYWANGAENQVGTSGSSTIKPQVALSFGNLNQSDGVTQLGGNFQVNYLTQNGAKFGNFSGVSIGSDGIVTALFDNGVRSPVFQIPIATFANPDGMGAQSGNTWIDTSSSGAYTLRSPGEAGSATVASSSLESSTVDLGTEFTNMITVQNAYSAAAKIITTTNQMLTDLINIKQ